MGCPCRRQSHRNHRHRGHRSRHRRPPPHRPRWRHSRRVGGGSKRRGQAAWRTARFRTIQVYPKDLRALPRQLRRAVSCIAGFGRARRGCMLERRRRAFSTLLGGAACAWPRAARAQQGERMRRIGVLMNASEGVAEARANVAALREALQQLGWIAGGNIAFDVRWGGGDATLTARHAAELIRLQADVLVAAGAAVVAAIQRASSTIPVVFAQAIDPVGAGIVDSLARPGGSTTGFTQFEYGLSGKWPELVKEIARRVKRVAVVRDSTNPAGIGQWAIIQASAASLGMEVSPISVREQAEIERGIAAFARGPDLALIVPVSARAVIHQQ